MTKKNSFSRLELLIGKDNLDLLSKKCVLVVGIGGVGGHVCDALVRSGIGKIVIVDFDIVDITNINRQIVAFRSTIGRKKVDVMKERLLDINPDLDIVCYDRFLDKNNLDEVFSINFDYVVDACDSVDTKKVLIDRCLKNNIPIISSMGTARKMDPSKLEITSIKKTINDPLARIIRKFMRDEEKEYDLEVLSSTELPIKTLGLGSNAFVPSSAGLLIASHIIKRLIN